jgi:hypothetical protein
MEDSAVAGQLLEHHPNNRLRRSDKDARQNKELELFSDAYRSEEAPV